MGRVDEQDEAWPTLCLKIQDQSDVAQGMRILRGEESLGEIRCVQLFVFFCLFIYCVIQGLILMIYVTVRTF